VCLSISLPSSMSICPSVYLPVFLDLSFSLSLYQSVCLYLCLSICTVSAYLTVTMYNCVSVHLPVFFYVYLPVCPSPCLFRSVFLSFCLSVPLFAFMSINIPCVHVPVHQTVTMYNCLTVHPPVFLSVCSSICPFFFSFIKTVQSYLILTASTCLVSKLMRFYCCILQLRDLSVAPSLAVFF